MLAVKDLGIGERALKIRIEAVQIFLTQLLRGVYAHPA
jgi:hypothetical protein